jgi:hypothetical protein
LKRQLLLVAGRKLLSAMEANGARQRVVPLGEFERYIREGWEFQANLPNGNVAIRLLV